MRLRRVRRRGTPRPARRSRRPRRSRHRRPAGPFLSLPPCLSMPRLSLLFDLMARLYRSEDEPEGQISPIVADRKCNERPAMRRSTGVAAMRRLPTERDQAQPCLEFQQRRMSGRSRLVESAGAAGKESALMPNRTLAIDLHAHALIPEVEALVHGQEGLRREQEARADWATKES